MPPPPHGSADRPPLGSAGETSPSSRGTVLAVAPTGPHAKADVPHLPVSTEEVATAAADCERVGASVLDLQPRHDTALPDVVAAVRARTDLIVRVAAYARSETLETLLDSGADVVLCPLSESGDFVVDLHRRARARGIAVHHEVTDAAQLPLLSEITEASGAGHPQHVVLAFGERAMPGDISGVAAAVEALPSGSTFTAVGSGPQSVPVLLFALAAGGHVRVGMGETLLYSEGVQVRDNTQLAARAAGVAKIAQRPPTPPAQAREVLGLPPTG